MNEPIERALQAYVTIYAHKTHWRWSYKRDAGYAIEAACTVAAAAAGVNPLELSARVQSHGRPPWIVSDRQRWIDRVVDSLTTMPVAS